jgi:hypothetical protein
MKTKLLFLFSIFLFVSFCERNENPKNEPTFENETFIYLHFKTEQECLDAQPTDFFINCHSELTFMENGQAEIILTDIIWRAEYSVIKNKIVLTFKNNPEIPGGTIIFQILNTSKLKKVDDKTIWNKMDGDSIWE